MLVEKRPNVIRDTIKALESGRLLPSIHAQVQMEKRDVQMSDVEEMICRARREETKDTLTRDKRDWKYALRGLNDSGDKDIRIVILFKGPDAVIVTVIDKYKRGD